MSKRLTSEELLKIKEMLEAGYTYSEIAECLDRSYSTIHNICHKNGLEQTEDAKKRAKSRSATASSRAHKERAEAKTGSICWLCRKTNFHDCSWFNNKNPIMPEGCSYEEKEEKAVNYTGGNITRRKVTLYIIKECPNFERDERGAWYEQSIT